MWYQLQMIPNTNLGKNLAYDFRIFIRKMILRKRQFHEELIHVKQNLFFIKSIKLTEISRR